jgi:iron(III) transport system permease protein
MSVFASGAALILFLLVAGAPVAAALSTADPGQALAALPLWGRTAALAAAGALGACLIGIPVGWAIARGTGRRVLLGLTLAQAILPTTCSAIGWISAFGAQGSLVSWNGLYGPAGVPLVWACCFWPLVALAVWGALSRLEPALEEAALLSLPPWRVLLAVTLPAAFPVLLPAGAVAWILMLADLGVPGCLQVPVGAESVHARFVGSWDAAGAAGMSLPMLALACAAVLLSWKGIRAFASGGDPRTEGTASPLRRPVSCLAALLAVAVIGIPVSGLAGWAGRDGFPRALGLLGNEGRSTLMLAAGTGLLASALGFAVSAVLAGRPMAMRAAAGLAVLAFALPGTLVGMGLIRIWNAPDWRGAVYGSWGILLLAALARSLAPALLMAWSAFRAIPRSYDEAARLCGLPFWRRTLAISLPLGRGRLAAGALLAAVVAAGEVAATSLVSPPGVQTLAARLFSLIHFGADGVVGATALMGMAGVVVLGFGIAFALVPRS